MATLLQRSKDNSYGICDELMIVNMTRISSFPTHPSSSQHPATAATAVQQGGWRRLIQPERWRLWLTWQGQWRRLTLRDLFTTLLLCCIGPIGCKKKAPQIPACKAVIKVISRDQTANATFPFRGWHKAEPRDLLSKSSI